MPGISAQLIEFQLHGEHIRVCDLLKATGVAASGAQGKQLVTDGLVTVDGRPEDRRTAKIRSGQTVACRGIRIVVLGS
ncbi:MAG: RNA-binding S4 domain-containing protein [Betaproteobacteria bacterium]|nr:RNA-binding S4 domain-containing protein [Betaproteobacteria bacterium]